MIPCNRSLRVILAALLLLPLLPLAAQQNSAPQKYALVIGNGAYASVTRLNNPPNDANDIKTALEDLGFQVDLVLDGSLRQMNDAVRRLSRNLTSPGSYGFFFYAGHGVQSKGENYLIPVDADIKEEEDLPYEAMNVQRMLDSLQESGNALNMIVLDACRDNPYGFARSGSRGLTVVASQPPDSIIMYATSAGRTASDGQGRNGLFTTEFLKNLKTPGLEVKEIFNRTGRDVRESSNSAQIPAIYSQFFGNVYLSPASARTARQTPDPVVRPTPQPAPVVQPAAQTQRPAPAPDRFVWINGGTFTMGSPANEVGRADWEGPQHQVTVRSFYMGKYEVTQSEYEAVMGTNPSNFKGPNLPVEQVSWFDAVEYCNKRSQREGLSPAYSIRGTGDSRTVSLNRNANGYRLPTEAEWEYACRAGTATRFNTGNAETSLAGYANRADQVLKEKHPDWLAAWKEQIPDFTIVNIRDGYGETAPAGSFRPNAWGLYDMHGNVWEWCWDWFGGYASGAQTDPMGATSGTNRVRRGGSWNDGGQGLRSANRNFHTPGYRGLGIGFRLVRPRL
jgi:formylglycine-generating enzyme required for sulfatase activity